MYRLGNLESVHNLNFAKKYRYTAMHVVIRAVEWEVAWNVNKFCVYVLPIPLCMLSNILDTVNKHKTTWADIFKSIMSLNFTWTQPKIDSVTTNDMTSLIVRCPLRGIIGLTLSSLLRPVWTIQNVTHMIKLIKIVMNLCLRPFLS